MVTLLNSDPEAELPGPVRLRGGFLPGVWQPTESAAYPQDLRLSVLPDRGYGKQSRGSPSPACQWP